MPLKLHPPRAQLSPNWRIRGTHLKCRIDQSAGTGDRALAVKILAALRNDIECGAIAGRNAPSFADAALNHMQMGGERRFIAPLLRHFGNAPLTAITQNAIDAAALALYPRASAATRNRQVYAPCSAILRRAKINIVLQRPKGARGTGRVAWLSPDEAFAIIAAARANNPSFAALLTFLLYTGARLSEALTLRCEDIDMSRAVAVLHQHKTGNVRSCPLHAEIMSALRTLPRGLDRRGETVFRLTKCGRIYTWLGAAATQAGVEIPARVAFHIFRHTWATWLRRYEHLDTAALVATGAWKSRAAAAIYEHADQQSESSKALNLPRPTRAKSVQLPRATQKR